MSYLKGGHIAFDINPNAVASYIYTRDTDGTIYFGLVRKLYSNGRKVIPRRSTTSTYITTGAAGTKEKYWGKWTSIGGNRDAKKKNLAAIIEELNHETGITRGEIRSIPEFDTQTVDLSEVGLDYKNKDPSRLKCKYINMSGSVIVSIFSLKRDIFFKIFPKEGKTSPVILHSSDGEIDATASFTIKQIQEFQEKAVTKKQNNFYISYFLENLIHIVLPILTPTNIPRITILPDINSREPWELLHDPYRRKSDRSYVNESTTVRSIPIPDSSVIATTGAATSDSYGCIIS